MKKDYYIVGLIGIGAVAVLYMLYRQQQATAPAAQSDEPSPVPDTLTPVYPTPQALQLGNVTIQETPPNQNYNLSGTQLPTVQVGQGNGSCECESDCDQAGIAVTVQTIPDHVLKSATDNLSTFQDKITSGVEAARAEKQKVTTTGQPKPLQLFNAA